MDAWWQCEVPYPFVPQEVIYATDSVRASLPNRYCDPKVAADLFEEVIDEFLLCDDLGLNVLAVEHHAGSIRSSAPIRCWSASLPGRRVRCGSSASAPDIAPKCPVRVAEEYANGGRHLARPARDRLRQIGRHRDGVEQREPREQHRALLGGDRPHQEGAQPSRRPIHGRVSTYRTVREHLAPPWQAPHPRMWAGRGIPRPRPRSGGAAWCTSSSCAGRRDEAGLRGASQGARRAGLAEVTTDNFAYAALSTSATRTKRGSASEQAPGPSTRASSRLRSTRGSCPAPRRRAAPQSIGRRRSRAPAAARGQWRGAGDGRATGGVGDADPLRHAHRHHRGSRRWSAASCSRAAPTRSTSSIHGLCQQGGRRLRPSHHGRPVRLP